MVDINKPPKKIYLQWIGCDKEMIDFFEPQNHDYLITWMEDRQYDTDSVYILQEEEDALQAELDKMRQERDEWKGLARKDFKEHAPEFVLDDIYLRLRTLYGD